MNHEIETFIDHFLQEIRADNAAIFVGAGLSRAAGYVDWFGLLEPLAKELNVDVNQVTDLVGLAQFYLNHHDGNRHRLTQALIGAFCDVKAPTANHMHLARLPIRTYWTTNYDRMIEEALKAANKKVDAKYKVKQLANTVPGRDVTLFKMHGDVEQSAEAVLTRDDYERYHLETKHGPFVTALSGDLVEKTFLFVGFSFTDPNLSYILSRIRVSFENHQRQHYCIMKRRAKGKGEKDEEFAQAELWQQLMIRDLRRFNITTLLVDEYEQVTEILATMERRFRRRTVLISGSAIDFGGWGRDATESALVRLSRELVAKDFRVTTGFGLGVGAAIVTGATQAIYSSPTKTVQDSLVMRPFPISVTDPAVRKETFRRYREELVGQSGIAVFFLGNKLTEGKTDLADGLREEFDLAVKAGLVPIPVGASGFMAAELWKEVVGNIGKYFPRQTAKIEPLLRKLGEDGITPEAGVDLVLSIIDILGKD
jgi:hypothetical protein